MDAVVVALFIPTATLKDERKNGIGGFYEISVSLQSRVALARVRCTAARHGAVTFKVQGPDNEKKQDNPAVRR